MKRLVTIAFLAVSIIAQAQHKETRKISNSRGIDVSSSIQATYIHSNRNEVVVEVENMEHLKKLETVVENGILFIRYKSRSNIRTSTPNRVTIYTSAPLQAVKVTSSASLRLESAVKASSFDVDVNSSGKLLASQITAEDVHVDVSSSGRFDGRLSCSSLDIEASSSGKIVLAGTADQADIDMSSSANANLADLKIKRATIEASSSAQTTVQVAGRLKADVSSSGKVYYIGKPESVEVEKSSGGQVVQK